MVFCGVSASDASAFLPAAAVAGCLPASATGVAGAAALEAVGAGFGMPGLSDIKVRGAMVFCFPFVSDERICFGQKLSSSTRLTFGVGPVLILTAFSRTLTWKKIP